MGLIDILFRDPIMFLLLAGLLLYSIIIHEVAHGWVASLFGDNTARVSGRLSLDPRLHLDPIGALMLLFAGFGWAKPVPVNYSYLRHGRAGVICVSLAGCCANILLATFALFFIQFPSVYENSFLYTALLIVVRINIILGAFNLIPIPPLDGSKILMGVLPYRAQMQLALLEPYGFFILIVLLLTRTLDPIIDFIQGFILLGISLLFRLFQGS